MADLYDYLVEAHRKLESIPPEIHWFCPKITADDPEEYSNPHEKSTDLSDEERSERIQASIERRDLAYKFCLILGISEEQGRAWQVWYVKRLNKLFTNCHLCIRNWHRHRQVFLKSLAEQYSDEAINTLSERLNEIDFMRVNRGMRQAEDFIRSQPPDASITQTTLATVDSSLALAMYEALCSMAYLSLPENRTAFNLVFNRTQVKKPLKMQEILPTMTVFLFQGDRVGREYAVKAWQRIATEDLMTAEDFEWAVHEHLAHFLVAAAQPGVSPDKIIAFWSGFSLILDTLNQELILNCLRAMEVQPDVYTLLINHMDTNSVEILTLLLQVFTALITKSSKALWQAYAGWSIPMLAEQIFKNPAYPALLGQRQPDGTGITSHPAIQWISEFMKSISLEFKNDTCNRLLYHLLEVFKHSSTGDGPTLCVYGGLLSLYSALQSLSDQTWNMTTLIHLNSIINLVIKYRDDVLGQLTNKGGVTSSYLRDLSMGVIQTALELDVKGLKVERKILVAVDDYRPTVPRKSVMLWDAMLQSLWPGRLDLAMKLMKAIMLFGDVAPFTRVRYKEKGRDGDKRSRWLTVEVSPARAAFNAGLETLAEKMGEVVQRVGELRRSELAGLSQDASSIRSLVVMLTQGQDAIKIAGVSLLKVMTDEDDKAEAMGRLLERSPSAVLQSFVYAVQTVTRGDPSLGAHQNILSLSLQLVGRLCDASSGLLRARSLSPKERGVVTSWWKTEWMWIDQTLRDAELFSTRYPVDQVQTLCGELMGFAETLMQQDGVVASAVGDGAGAGAGTGTGAGAGVGGPLSESDGGNGDGTNDLPGTPKAAMKLLLEDAGACMRGLAGMLALKDLKWLQAAVNVISRLLHRLQEYDVAISSETKRFLQSVCVANAKGTYGVATNLTDQQRIELLQIITPDESDDEVEVIEVRKSSTSTYPPPAQQQVRNKQATVDAWARGSDDKADSKPGAAATAAQHTPAYSQSRLDLSGFTPHSDRNRELVDRLKATQEDEAAEKAAAKARMKAAQQASEADKILAIREVRQREKEETKRRNAEAAAAARKKALGNLALVPGDGSGLAGLGLRGREHARAGVKSDIMVGDTSSEDSDEDVDLRNVGRAAGGRGALGASGMTERQRQLAMKQIQQGPVKKIKVMRTAKDLRARVVPPMEVLHHAILEWDIFHEGEDPPTARPCETVFDTYRDPVSYKRTFFPLLISEAWRSFVTAKDENTSPPFGVKVVTRMSVDRFIEANTSVQVKDVKDRHLTEGDIVVLSKSNQPLEDKSAPHCLARIWKVTYKKDHLEVLYRISNTITGMIQTLTPGADIYAVKITNMTTIEREYAALESLQYYDLMEEVLSARPSHILKFGDERVENVGRTFGLNAGQAKAVLSARENDGFTLIQGPPGTGKTKTIVAMVGALLTTILTSFANNSGATAISRPHGAPAPAPGKKEVPKKLLVCAPSNAAVDELVLRLKSGVKTMNGTFFKVNVLRLGRSDAINAAVKDVTIDELVRMRLEGDDGKDGGLRQRREQMHQRAGELKELVGQLRPKLEAARESEPVDRAAVMKLQREFDNLKREQAIIGARIDADKESGNTVAREVEVKRRQIQQEILNEAHVLCATLSGSGHDMFRNLQVEFETVIIDEAAQCVELSALIPLKYGCTKCILVGDPKQLPPTVLSQSAARYGYDQSLFVRMQRNSPNDVHLLDRQYRMHPAISAFPSQEFYDGRLIDGDDMAKLRHMPWHESGLLGPYRFFDVKGSQDKGGRGKSLINVEELKVAMQLYHRFRTDFGGGDSSSAARSKDGKVDLKGKIGIITPYKAQLNLLRDEFVRRYGEQVKAEIEFNTTDAFQGRECEVIIFSCVRASPTGGIGFMNDIRRMNVGLTRAKSSLWILGNSKALMQGQFWAKLIDDARKRSLYTSGDIADLFRRPLERKGGGTLALPPAPPAQQPPRESNAAGASRDVDMTDAPPPPPPRGPNPTNAPPTALVRRPSGGGRRGAPPFGGGRDQPGPPVRRASGGGRGGAGGLGIPSPFIPTGPAAGSHKRHRDSMHEAGPPPKRPLGPGAKVPPPPQPQPPNTDPSAMEVLGLVPPERRPPQAPTNPPPARRPPQPLIPKKKPAANPFIQKKPNKPR